MNEILVAKFLRKINKDMLCLTNFKIYSKIIIEKDFVKTISNEIKQEVDRLFIIKLRINVNLLEKLS